jgi:hypothetical protein
MRHLKYLALLGVFVAVAAVPSPAQISIGVHIGPDYGYYHVPPACPYGYYPDYPFGCAPYGYWGPEWFADGVFIGAGPWYRFYYVHPVLYQRWYGPGYVYFPRHFHRFHDDWDGDRRFHGFESDHRFRGDRDFHRFDRDDRGFRRIDGDRFDRNHWAHDRGFRGDDRRFRVDDHGFRGHDHGRDHDGRGHGHDRDRDHGGGGHGR